MDHEVSGIMQQLGLGDQFAHSTFHNAALGAKAATVDVRVIEVVATGTALARPCDGVMRLGNTARLRRLCAGRLPYQLVTWSDGLVEASDGRPVVHLD